MEKKRYLKISLALIIGIIFHFLNLGLPKDAHAVLVVAIISSILWLTEAIPLHVTSLVIAFLLAVFAKIPKADVFAPFFDPVIALLLGGFVIAVALQKYGLDKKIAYTFIQKVGSTPKRFMVGIMAFTAFFSMWITNTATTAAVLPIATAVLVASKIKKETKYAKALILGVAYSATIGGIATLIGSTPNAIVASFLAKEGITIDFVSWMYYALPFVLVMIPISAFILLKIFKPEIKRLKIKEIKEKYSSVQKRVLWIFLITIVLWLTSKIHGISSSIIALVPIILLYTFKLLEKEDFQKVNWNALILFGGGLSLGSAIHTTGLDLIMANGLKSAMGGLPIFIILLSVATFGLVLTAFISNTAAAALMIPIMLPLSKSLGLDIKVLAILAALGVSFDLILPIGTPPGTMAYSTGYIKVWDMVKSGLIISAIGLIILTTFAYTYW